jgi:hypothetical protein
MGGPTWALVLALRLLGQSDCVTHYSNGLEPRYAQNLIRYFGSPRLDRKPLRWYERLYARCERLAFSQAGWVVTVSPIEEAWCAKHLNPNCSLILNPVSADFCVPVPAKKKQAVFASSWLTSKGSDFFPQAFEPLRAHRDWNFVLVGGVPADIIPADLADRVRIVPAMPKKELAALFAESRVVFAPTMHESFHLVVTEALSLQCHVVTSCEGIAASMPERPPLWLIPQFNAADATATLTNAIRWADAGNPFPPVDMSPYSEAAHSKNLSALFPLT